MQDGQEDQRRREILREIRQYFINPIRSRLREPQGHEEFTPFMYEAEHIVHTLDILLSPWFTPPTNEGMEKMLQLTILQAK